MDIRRVGQSSTFSTASVSLPTSLEALEAGLKAVFSYVFLKKEYLTYPVALSVKNLYV